jgi:retinol dehydrogenase 12
MFFSARLVSLTMSDRNRNPIRAFKTQVTPLPVPTNDFSGKTVIVTGANVGLGLAAAQHFVRLNAQRVILGCRSLVKGEERG